ncbi:T9SS type A sorting domain-containing protein [Dyadobacter sp. CY312]|uniref:T9SS type A sorting domain-containing protein n=1 Tax=Dyadobacter sp. CY312 TaxID=2907303 RepID=UPI001F33A3BE|nr:T9SS type A sorting domain-containing protein [Dyadobacter sp. CY312]MCE7044420.1 T9SS type A sorting domain-containing protein [Dyadobacter sp. CY312]
MCRIIKPILPFWILLHLCLTSRAQSPGSGNTENSSRYIGGTRTTLGETLYIGPDADITVDGTWYVYSKYVWISPAAKISGGGQIVFHNSGDEGGAGGPTVIDGNDNLFIDVNIVHDNTSGMEIKNVPLSASLASAGWSDNTAVSTLKIGKDFNLNRDGADVWLDVTAGVIGDFVFDNDATISGYRPNRMVITNNSIQSHMVKQDASSGFVFPIGISNGNYTPAQVTASGNYHASVQDYGASTSNESLLHGGMARTWHVYADTPTVATVAFQHYVADDTSPFSSASPHFITQYQGTSWSSGTEEAGLSATLTTNTAVSPVPGSSLQDLSGVPVSGSGAAFSSYFTKTNQNSLPVTLTVFKVVKEGSTALLSWRTTEETNADRFEIERSTDAKTWKHIGEKIAYNGGTAVTDYSFVDHTPESGINYYRLKMIDFDNTYSHSRVQSLSFDQSAVALVVYPNPVSERLYLKDVEGKTLSMGSVTGLSVVNSQGYIVLRSTGSVSSEGLDVRHLPTGMYTVSITLANGTLSTHKLIVTR